MRVTRGEARIYPTVTFEAQPSEYIPMLQSDPALQAFESAEIETDFEFLVNSNSYLRVTQKAATEAQAACLPAFLVRACDRRLRWQRGLAACV